MRANSLLSTMKNKISSGVFQITHRIGDNSFIRERKLTFEMVFSTILKLVKKSLSIECEWLEPCANKIPPSKQALSKARYKIRHTGFQELLEDSLICTYKDEPDYGTWRGYRLIAADGSSLRLPDSKEIVNQFGRHRPNGTEGKMPPLGRVSLFVDLCTSMICSARLEPWSTGEQSMAQEQLSEVTSQMRLLGQERLLFIYDRGYPSLKFIKQHQDLGVDFIFRVQERAYLSLWERVASGESDFEHRLETRDGSTQVRVISLVLNSGKTEVLITSLFNKEAFTSKDMSKIYFLRWHIEECYKRLKVCMEIENFSGVHYEAVLQEFWAHLLMNNVLSLQLCDAQGPWNPDNPGTYRLNFSVLFGVMRQQLQQVILGTCEPELFQKLFDRAALRAKIKIRPNRVFSRDKVGKPKRHQSFRRVC